MNKSIRWRIITLQSMLVVILACASGFLLYEGNFVTGMVHDQLVAQKIHFPMAGSPALSPAEFPDLQQYAGQQVDNGDKAKAYADGFIGRHLKGVAGGLTYSQVSAMAMADPTNTTLSGQVATLFKGETLRSILLNSYGWWTAGLYATYAGIVFMIATLGVLGMLVFELFIAGRKPEILKVAQRIAA